MPTDALLAVENVAFEIEGRTILHPLRMAVGAGRMVGVIGHNGSGKSTLGKILARQVRPSAGSLQVLGQCAEAIGARGFARLVAYLPQQIPPAVGMTVRELVAMGRYPWLGAFKSPTQHDIDKVEEGMATTLVNGLAGRLVDTLSGGERQRVWLGMLVAQQARILVLDEPTSALDIRHQVEVLSLLRSLCARQNVGWS
ncbi:ABC transporter ATP-binding protein [Bordetella petrii]|uniref:ABC transporter ATP-binding protein n=1 Tax=Bordetella petrii TaxID=94624 RepID=UPI0001628DBB|nr:ATP-binding cassette domain-containing protein [Bordetella petrii]CAP44555.1 pseudogene [Bordetella petrii]